MSKLLYHKSDFRFPGLLKGDPEGVCDLKIYAHAGRIIVVAADLYTEDGDHATDSASVTGGIEKIARLASQLLQDFRAGNWHTLIEFHPVRGSAKRRRDLKPDCLIDPFFDETIALIVLDRKGQPPTYSNAFWDWITRADLEHIIGRPYVYEYTKGKVR